MAGEIKKIRAGAIYAQANEGTLNDYGAPTIQASYTIEGQTLTNRVYLFSSKIFNMKNDYAPLVRVTGVLSGAAVKTSSSTNNVELEAGTAYVNGTSVTVSADATNAIVRPAAGKYAISALTVNASGTTQVIKGADGDAYDWTGGYGGAGQMPYCVVTDTVLAYIATYDSGAAVIPQTDIFPGDTANVSYRIDPLRGGLVLNQALAANQTGGVRRTIYVRFYDITASLVAVGKLSDATLTIQRGAPVNVSNHESQWDAFESVGTLGWSASVSHWRADQAWIDKFVDPTQDKFLLKMYEDATDSYYYLGIGILQGSLPIGMKRGPVSESLQFQGTGELRRI